MQTKVIPVSSWSFLEQTAKCYGAFKYSVKFFFPCFDILSFTVLFKESFLSESPIYLDKEKSQKEIVLFFILVLQESEETHCLHWVRQGKQLHNETNASFVFEGTSSVTPHKCCSSILYFHPYMTEEREMRGLKPDPDSKQVFITKRVYCGRIEVFLTLDTGERGKCFTPCGGEKPLAPHEAKAGLTRGKYSEQMGIKAEYKEAQKATSMEYLSESAFPLWCILELFDNEHGNGIWQNIVPPNCDNISAFSCQVQTSVSSFHFSVQNFCLSFVYLNF
ncbi:hypothetical protein EK904_009886 [Melospiza melodia maxima]|nr:hypothetical protein EK904_009886 [Melospiza melodia maxima]